MMKKIRVAAIALVGVCVAALGFGLAGCETTDFDASTHTGDGAVASQASSYWRKEGWWSLKQKTGKVMITEFSVEFIQKTDSDIGGNYVGALAIADWVGVGDATREYDGRFKRSFPGKLYTQFVAALEKQGYSVIPMDQVTSHPAFGKIASDMAGSQQSKGTQGWSPVSRGTESTYVAYPAPGLPTVDDSWFQGHGNYKAEAEVASGLGADLSLRVRIRCGVDNKGYPVLSQGSTIRVLSSYRKTGSDYWAETNGMVVGSKGFRNDTPVATKEDFRAFDGDILKVDEEKFGPAILEMFPTYAQMGIYVMKK